MKKATTEQHPKIKEFNIEVNDNPLDSRAQELKEMHKKAWRTSINFEDFFGKIFYSFFIVT